MKKADFDKIEQEVKEKYLLDKYKSICEIIEDLNLQMKFLDSHEGRKIANELAGSKKVEEDMAKISLALKERKVEQEFIKSLLK